jgi:protein-disulfide isomerase
MLRLRLVAALTCIALVNLVSCQTQAPSSGEQPAAATPRSIQLAGVDTSKLTEREREQWSTFVGELLAPCPDQPVSLAQCVAEKRPCNTCLPAANFLTHQVTRGKTRSQAEAAYRARFSPDEVKEIEPGDSPGKGAADPLVTIVEWADFECPFCAVASPVLSQAVARHSKHARLVFKHYPLGMHEHAEAAARAATAAGMQGKFWEYHSLLFQNQQALDEATLDKLAKQVGLDVAQFTTDRKSEAVADRVAADRKQADALGLKGTPTLYINGRAFDLEKFDLAEDLDAWIELEVALRSGANAQPTSGRASGSGSAVTAGASSGVDQPVSLEKKDAPAAASAVPASSATSQGEKNKGSEANKAAPNNATPSAPPKGG